MNTSVLWDDPWIDYDDDDITFAEPMWITNKDHKVWFNREVRYTLYDDDDDVWRPLAKDIPSFPDTYPMGDIDALLGLSL